MHHIYVIRSLVNNQLYTGMTDNVERRVEAHNHKHTASTSKFVPWELVYTEAYTSAEEARKREKYLKTGQGRRFLKQKINCPVV